jgi:hypothetical protein
MLKNLAAISDEQRSLAADEGFLSRKFTSVLALRLVDWLSTIWREREPPDRDLRVPNLTIFDVAACSTISNRRDYAGSARLESVLDRISELSGEEPTSSIFL